MKRDRNHVLEDLSVNALRAELPALWVMHDFRRDYGIDVQIEIFDSDGNTTGLRVYGQLKATDKNEIEDSLSLDRDHFGYWASHTDPVLLVRFFAGTRTLKWCWMHDVEWRMKPTAASLNVSPHLERWHQKETPKAIENLVRLRREVLQHQLPLPATIRVSAAFRGLEDSLKLADLIRSRLPASSFKIIGESALPCHFDFLYENKKLRLSHVGLPGFVVTCDGEDEFEHIADLAVLLLFLISCRYDRSLVARIIARQSSIALFNAASQEFLPLFIEGLMYSLGVDQAMPMILGNLKLQEDPVAWFIVYAAGLRACERYGQKDQWQKQLKDWADSPPYAEMAASAAYNAANFLAQNDSWDDALIYYRLASQRDPGYLEKDYYWAELGAAQFETDQASAAAMSYQKAFDINKSYADQWRLGDAQFHCGRYEAACENIRMAIANDPSVGSYPRLVMLVCEELITIWGIREQTVEPVSESIQNKLMKLAVAGNAEELMLKLRPFLDICAIDPLLSFNAGHFAGISGQPEIALYRFLTCALMHRGDAQAWANAITSAISAGKVELLQLLMEAAYFHVGEALPDAVLKSFCLPDGLPNEAVTAFQQQLLTVIRSLEMKRDKSFVIRAHGPSETEVFEIKN
jgi:tetratricopeptide (TPR) repeat protein